MVFLTLPMAVGMILVSPYLVPVLSGPGYGSAIPVAAITSSIIFVIGLSNVLGMQVFYPLGKIGLVNLCTGIGALVGLVVNLLLIKPFGATGSAIATVAAEMGVTLSMMILGRKYIPFTISWHRYLDYILGAAAMLAAVLLLRTYVHLPDVMMLLLLCAAGVLVYAGILAVRNNVFYLEVKDRLVGLLRKK